MKKLSYITGTVLLLMGLPSCGFLDVEPHVIEKGTFYISETEVLYGLAGVYGAMSTENFYGQKYSIILSYGDDLSCWNRATPNSDSYSAVYLHDAGSVEIYNCWVQIYTGIRNANAFMNAVADSEYDPDRQYWAEAKFLRAYYHFILAEAWGDVPLVDYECESAYDSFATCTPQYDVLKWAIQEMEDSLPYLTEDVTVCPSRICHTTAEAIIARVCMFTAGATVDRRGDDAMTYWNKALYYTGDVIGSGKHDLNDSYSQVFINYISNQYDTQYYESMWEVEFNGNRSSADKYSNGRHGDTNGLQSSQTGDYENCNCNYGYGQYGVTLKLWDLYWQTDRTDDENALAGRITDERQDWNMPPYNYNGGNRPCFDDPSKTTCVPGIDKTSYFYGNVYTCDDIMAAAGDRNIGKFRREVIYEGLQTAKNLYTHINFPILRYSDVLLMYAEAANEVNKAPTKEAYDAVVEVRSRAGVATRDFGEYDYGTFTQLVRNERARELCFESLRKYDLIRWGIFVDTMNGYSEWADDARFNTSSLYSRYMKIGAAVQPKHIVLPIPSIELGVNDNLRQNPLW